MSRIGQNPIEVPSGVDIKIDGRQVTAKGQMGEESFELSRDVELSHEDKLLWVKPVNNSKRARVMWGTNRSMVQNLVTGVSEGFTYDLEIHGVGYRAAVQGKKLNLQLGFSHEVNHPIPDGVTVSIERNTQVQVKGSNKQRIGQFCAEVRAYRPPEPYKGKGIRYANEYILRKEGKKK